MNDQLKNLRCIFIARCSSDPQIEVSIDKQTEMGKAYIEQNGMFLVDVDVYPGMSASLGVHYKRLYQLIERKRRQNDFDAVLLLSYDRFCRGGTNEGNKIAEDFEAEGVKIITIREGLIDGELAWLMRGMVLHQANKYVVDLSFNLAAGWERSLEAKRIPHAPRTPYGLDKLYLASNEKPLYVLRELPNGDKARLDVTTGELIEMIPKGQRGPFRQPGERIVFTKGDPQTVAWTRHIFRRHFIDGWGTHRIAAELNQKGIPTKRGRKWMTNTIETIYRNPIYIGYGYANTESVGIYHSRARGKPIQHRRSRKLENRKDGKGVRKTLEPISRDRKDWVKVEQPLLEDYLEPNLRAVVARFHAELERGIEKQKRRKRGGDRHVDSPYLLKNIIWERNTNSRMYSTSKRDRRYAVTFTPGMAEKRVYSVNAVVAETAVLHILQHILPNREHLRSKIVEAIADYQKASTQERQQMDELRIEKEQIVTELRHICSLGPMSQEVLSDRKQQCEVRLTEIARKEHLAKQDAIVEGDIEKVVNKVLQQATSLLKADSEMPRHQLRGVIETYIPRICFDCYTTELEIEIALPSWAISKEAFIREQVGVVTEYTSPSCNHTPADKSPNLANYRGIYRKVGRRRRLEIDPYPMFDALPTFIVWKNSQKKNSVVEVTVIPNSSAVP